MKSKGGKIHFYPGNTAKTQKGFTSTACGRDGYYVGGFIELFFRITEVKDRCKTCNKIYQKEKRG